MSDESRLEQAAIAAYTQFSARSHEYARERWLLFVLEKPGICEHWRSVARAVQGVLEEESDERIERVAKALYDDDGKQYGGYEDGPRPGIRTYRQFEWEELTEIDKAGVRRHAKAALAAAREGERA